MGRLDVGRGVRASLAERDDVVDRRRRPSQDRRIGLSHHSQRYVTCFLRPGSATPAQVAACGKRFGADYTTLQKRSRDATADFLDLRKWAKERGWKPPSERKP